MSPVCRKSTITLLASAVLTIAATTAAQTPPQSQSPAAPAQAATPAQLLQQAHAVLNSIDSRAVSGDTARKLQTLRQDFGALETTFNEQLANGPAGNTAPGAMSTAGEKDWRVRYSSVDSDLRDLIGTDPMETTNATPPATGAADLDPRMKEQLQQVRTTLQSFFATTLGPSQPNAGAVAASPATPQNVAPTSTPANNTAADAKQVSDVMALLNRIQDIVNDTLKNTSALASSKAAPAAVGTTGVTASGAASNKVSIDRDKLDEIRVEVEQLKLLMKK